LVFLYPETSSSPVKRVGDTSTHVCQGGVGGVPLSLLGGISCGASAPGAATESAREVSTDQTAVSEREGSEPKIWYNGSFISYESYQQKTACISANVPCTILSSEVRRETENNKSILEHLHKYGSIYGLNFLPTDDQCGVIYRKIFCNSDRSHKPANLHIYCNDPLCPVCYKKFASRIAARVSERVSGFMNVNKLDDVRSLIFWPKKGMVYKNRDDAFTDAKRMLTDMGAKAAVIWLHPARIRKDLQPKLRRIQRGLRILEKPTKGFWDMAHADVLGIGGLENYCASGVHFHAQFTGYLENSKVYSERTGAGYKTKEKKIEDLENSQQHAYYVSTHASFETGKDMVRYFGKMSRYELHRAQTGEYIENTLCDVCGSTLAEYIYDARASEVSLYPIHSVVTRRIKVYQYWMRDRPPPKSGLVLLSASSHKKELRAMLDKARAAQNQKLKGWA